MGSVGRASWLARDLSSRQRSGLSPPPTRDLAGRVGQSAEPRWNRTRSSSHGVARRRSSRTLYVLNSSDSTGSSRLGRPYGTLLDRTDAVSTVLLNPQVAGSNPAGGARGNAGIAPNASRRRPVRVERSCRARCRACRGCRTERGRIADGGRQSERGNCRWGQRRSVAERLEPPSRLVCNPSPRSAPRHRRTRRNTAARRRPMRRLDRLREPRAAANRRRRARPRRANGRFARKSCVPPSGSRSPDCEGGQTSERPPRVARSEEITEHDADEGCAARYPDGAWNLAAVAGQTACQQQGEDENPCDRAPRFDAT